MNHMDVITDDDLARAAADGACEDTLARARECRRYSALPARDRAWAANWPRLRPEVVAQLARDPQWDVRVMVAWRYDLASALVEQLALDPDPGVRAAVARRDDIPRELVAQLAEDPDWHVRVEIADRRDLPAELREQLAADPHRCVRYVIARMAR